MNLNNKNLAPAESVIPAVPPEVDAPKEAMANFMNDPMLQGNTPPWLRGADDSKPKENDDGQRNTNAGPAEPAPDKPAVAPDAARQPGKPAAEPKPAVAPKADGAKDDLDTAPVPKTARVRRWKTPI